ncbi:MAG: ABC transporter ATP-binding protein [Eubacteriales bacterium]
MNREEQKFTRLKNVIRLSKRLKKYRLRMVAAVVVGVGNQLSIVAASVLGAWTVGLAIDGKLMQELNYVIAATIAAIIIRIVVYVLEMWICHDVAFKVLADFRIQLFDSIERVSPAILLNMRSGQLASTLMGDVEIMEWFFAHTFGSVLVAIITPLILMIILWQILPILDLVMLLFAVAAVLIPIWMKKKADEQGREVRKALADANAVTLEGVQGLKEILALNYRMGYEEKNRAYLERMYKRQFSYSKRLGTEGMLLQMVLGVSGLAAALIAAWYVGKDGMAASMYTIIVVLSAMILGPVIEVCNTARNFGLIFAAADRIYRVLEAKPLVQDLGHDINTKELTPEICFEHVSFRYREDLDSAVEDVSFHIKPGEHVAIAGASGAGKTTCIQLLLRNWDPEKGCICIGGKDIRDISLKSLNEMYATVLQDVYLFQIPILENIRLGRSSATDEEVMEAARKAFAHEFITELPDGYQTIAGEGGVKLSGGQRQRIAIARALLKDSPILVFDEAVSNLDTENERKIQESIERSAQNCTVVMIAHRLSTIKSADRIICLDHGKIAEMGTFKELMKKNGYLKKLLENSEEMKPEQM